MGPAAPDCKEEEEEERKRYGREREGREIERDRERGAVALLIIHEPLHTLTHTQSNSGKTHKPQIIIVIHFYLGVRRSFFFLYPIGFYSTPQLQGLYLLYYSCILHSCQVCTYYTTHAYTTVARSVPTILLMHTPQLPCLYLLGLMHTPQLPCLYLL